MYLTGNVDVDLPRVRAEKPWLHRGAQPGELYAPPRRPCSPVLTGTGRSGGHSREIALRCLCMAETYGPPSRNFYGYDPIAVVESLEDAAAHWQKHRSAQTPQLDTYA